MKGQEGADVVCSGAQAVCGCGGTFFGERNYRMFFVRLGSATE